MARFITLINKKGFLMNSISSDLSSSPLYHLSQEVLTYKGDCSICAEPNQSLFSMHQIEAELYDEEVHGPLKIHADLVGIYKDIEVTKIQRKVARTFLRPVFHQISLSEKDAKIHVFSPAHNACSSCIEKIKRIASAKCPLCRSDLGKVEYEEVVYSPSQPRRTHHFTSTTRPRINLSFKDPYNYFVGQDSCFADLSRSKKKTFLNEIVKRLDDTHVSNTTED
jgi:hypothetical protein